MESIHNSLSEWRKADIEAYNNASHKGLLPKICEMFGWEPPRKSKPAGYWDIKENCYAEFKKQVSITGWIKNSAASYNASKRNGWYDEWVEEIRIRDVDNIIKWDKEKILLSIIDFESFDEWRKFDKKSYNAAKRLNIIEEIANIKNWEYQRFNPTKEECMNIGLKYENKTLWRNDVNDKKYYNYAKRKGWLVEKRKEKGYWTKEKCIEYSITCNSRNDFYTKGKGAYEQSKKFGVLDECLAIIDGNILKIKEKKALEKLRVKEEKKLQKLRVKEEKAEIKKMNRKTMIRTNENLISKFKTIHGEKYDYSLVNYVDNKTKIKIICHEHGVFEMTADNHIMGRNCHNCYLKKRYY